MRYTGGLVFDYSGNGLATAALDHPGYTQARSCRCGFTMPSQWTHLMGFHWSMAGMW